MVKIKDFEKSMGARAPMPYTTSTHEYKIEIIKQKSLLKYLQTRLRNILTQLF